MTGPKVSKPITTISGKYYAGMTKAEAQRKDSYKKFVGMDFRDIDKNNDGVLSDAEICDARDKEVKRARTRKAVEDVSFGVMAGAGVIAATGVGTLLSAGVGAAGLACNAVALIGDHVDGVKNYDSNGQEGNLDAEIVKTAMYRKEHGLDIKM